MEFIDIVESPSSPTADEVAAKIESRVKPKQKHVGHSTKTRNQHSAQHEKKENLVNTSMRPAPLMPEQQNGNLSDTKTTPNAPDVENTTHAPAEQHVHISQQKKKSGAVITLTMGKGELRRMSLKRHRKKKRKAAKSSAPKKMSIQMKKGNSHCPMTKS